MKAFDLNIYDNGTFKVFDDEEMVFMLKKSLIGRQILFCCFFYQDNHCNSKTQCIDRKNEFENIFIGRILKEFGISVKTVYDYHNGISEIMSGEYYSVWIICGNGSVEYNESFNHSIIDFWKNGGSLVWLSQGDPYFYELNCFLGSEEYAKYEKIRFRIVGCEANKEILEKGDPMKETGVFDNRESIIDHGIKRRSIGAGIYKYFTGSMFSHISQPDLINPFIPFAKTKTGDIVSLYYPGYFVEGNDSINLKSTGDILIDCGYSKLMDGISELEIPKYLLNMVLFCARLEYSKETNFNWISNEMPIQLRNRVLDTLNIVRQGFERFQNSIAFCFNGGKDSTILLDMILRCSIKLKFDLKIFFIETNDNFQEIEDFIDECEKHWNINVLRIRADSTKNGLIILKEQFDIKAVILGIRQSDQPNYPMRAFEETSAGWPEAMRILPILDWNYQDIWNYIDYMNVPYCYLYTQGFTSIGSSKNSIPNPSLFDQQTGGYKHARHLVNFAEERSSRLSK